jgi:hypothetical protein
MRLRTTKRMEVHCATVESIRVRGERGEIEFSS